MLEYITNIFSYSSYASLAYVTYKYYTRGREDLSNISYVQDKYEYHMRLVNYYHKALNGEGRKKLN